MTDEVLFECVDDWHSGLAEVESLLEAAEASNDVIFSAALLKSSVLLLCGKLETLLESLAEEFVYELNTTPRLRSSVPTRLLVLHSLRLVDPLDQSRSRVKEAATISALQSLAELWGSELCSTKLEIDCTFSYGKHGEAEIQRLFDRLGIEDVFAAAPVSEKQEEADGTMTMVPVDVRGTINSLTNIRNNILHQDASPSLTPARIHEYERVLKLFVESLSKALHATIPTPLPTGFLATFYPG